MSDIDDNVRTDLAAYWQRTGRGALLVIRIGLMIASFVAICRGMSDISKASPPVTVTGSLPEVDASYRISGAILVGTGLCAAALVCSQFRPTPRRHDDSHPKV